MKITFQIEATASRIRDARCSHHLLDLFRQCEQFDGAEKLETIDVTLAERTVQSGDHQSLTHRYEFSDDRTNGRFTLVFPSTRHDQDSQ